MSAEIILDLSSPVPPFEQLRARITELVDDGTLAPGSRLPSVRALASDLGIAVGTVARAYRELEAAGYVRAAGRRGTLVSGHDERPDVADQAVELARAYVTGMRALGLGPEAMSGYLHRSLVELGT